MSTGFNSPPVRSEEDIRNARLARGLRAVAATVIVGGMVIAAFETQTPSSHSATPPGLLDESAGASFAEPSAPGAAPAAAPSEIDPALRRIDRGMEQHG